MRRNRTPEEWKNLIKEQADSNQSASFFCKSRGIHPNLFYCKRKQYGSDFPKSGFIELEIPPPTVIQAPYITIDDIQIHPGNANDKDLLKMIITAVLEAKNAHLQ